MDLLDWARGPLLVLALAIFLAGCGWRAWSLLRLPARAPGGRCTSPAWWSWSRANCPDRAQVAVMCRALMTAP